MSKAIMPSDPVMPKANMIHMLIVRAPKNGTQVMIFFIVIDYVSSNIRLISAAELLQTPHSYLIYQGMLN